MQVARLTVENAVLREEYHALWTAVQQANLGLNAKQLTSSATAARATQAQASYINPDSAIAAAAPIVTQSPVQSESPSGLLVPEHQDEFNAAPQEAGDHQPANSIDHQTDSSGSVALETSRIPGNPQSGSQAAGATPHPSTPSSSTCEPLPGPATQNPPKRVSFSDSGVLFETLKTVLQSSGVCMPQHIANHYEDDSAGPQLESQGGSLHSYSSGSSTWSGDEMLATYTAEQSSRSSSSSDPVQSLSGMLLRTPGAGDAGSKDPHHTCSDLDEDLDTEDEQGEEQEPGQPFRNSSIEVVPRCVIRLEVCTC
jgi:hypothetical protein